MDTLVFPDMVERLRSDGIPVTFPRLAIARVLFTHPVHVSAELVLERVREIAPDIARGTVYNTLKLFVAKGMLRELIVDPTRIFYDSTTTPHHHYYDVTTGELWDVPAGQLKVVGEPILPAGAVLEEIDVIVRVRRRAA